MGNTHSPLAKGPIYLSICLSTYLSIYRSIDLSIYRSIDLSIYLSTYLPISTYIYLSIYLSTYLSIYLSTYLPISTYIYLSIYLLSIYLSICLSIYLSVCLSVCLSICIYIYTYLMRVSLTKTYVWAAYANPLCWIRCPLLFPVPFPGPYTPLTAGVRIRDVGILCRTGKPDAVHEVHRDEIWQNGPSIPCVS